MMKKRRQHREACKFRVALKALEGSKTIIQFRPHHDTPSLSETLPAIPNSGSPSTTFTVSKLTLMTLPMERRMYWGLSARLGLLTMPLYLSVLTR